MRMFTDRFLGRWRGETPSHFPDTFSHFPPPNVGLPALPESVPAPVENVGANASGEVEKVAREMAVFRALLAAPGPLTMGQLAAAMGCSGGEATRRVQMSAAKLKRQKVGRCVYISLSR
jgi:hypothetical protein